MTVDHFRVFHAACYYFITEAKFPDISLKVVVGAQISLQRSLEGEA